MSDRRAMVTNKMSSQASGSEDEAMGKRKRKVFPDLLLETSLDGVTDEELKEEVGTFMLEACIVIILPFIFYMDVVHI
jgi:hypothetical protein